MKRLIAIFLTIFYLLPAIGFSFNIHWCCKKISSFSIGAPQPDKCKPCKAKSKCCKDAHLVVKITGSQYNSPSVILRANFIKQLATFINTTSSSLFRQDRVFDFTNYHAPPFKNKLPVYLANNIFRV
jgi:hypothetical protein